MKLERNHLSVVRFGRMREIEIRILADSIPRSNLHTLTFNLDYVYLFPSCTPNVITPCSLHLVLFYLIYLCFH